jgi:hypothetical protein
MLTEKKLPKHIPRRTANTGSAVTANSDCGAVYKFVLSKHTRYVYNCFQVHILEASLGDYQI